MMGPRMFEFSENDHLAAGGGPSPRRESGPALASKSHDGTHSTVLNLQWVGSCMKAEEAST
jgi:hypothetical protein